MVALHGEESCGVFGRLEPEDIAPVHKVECNAKAMKHLGRVEVEKAEHKLDL